MKRIQSEDFIIHDINREDPLGDFKHKALIEFDDVIHKFKDRKVSGDSEQTRRERAVKYLFTGSSLAIMATLTTMDVKVTELDWSGYLNTVNEGVDFVSKILSPGHVLFSGDNISPEYIDNFHSAFNNVKETLSNDDVIKLKNNMVEWLLEMNTYLDPEKVDYDKILSYIGGITNGVLTVELTSNIIRKPFEEKIAKYADDSIDSDSQKTKYATKKFNSAAREYKYKKAFYSILESKNIPLMVVDKLTDITSHLFNPRETLKKIWLKTKLAANEVRFLETAEKEIQRVHNRMHLNEQMDELNISLSNSELSKELSKELMKNRDELNTSEKESLKSKVIYDANYETYSEILKINTKRSLAKAFYVLGDQDKNKKERQEALNIIKSVEKINKLTKEKTFDDYEILSRIARDYLERINDTKKVTSYYSEREAFLFVNKKQREYLNKPEYMIETLNGYIVDESKRIKDVGNYNEQFKERLKIEIKKQKIITPEVIEERKKNKIKNKLD